jgi:hypothetical protein
LQEEPNMTTFPDAAALPPEVVAACEIAASDGEPLSEPITVAAAVRDRWCRKHWHRMVWRGGAWQYLHDRPLANGRDDTVWGAAWPGELLAEHNHRGPVRYVWLVVRATSPLSRCPFHRPRPGVLAIRLPNDRTIERPDPRPRRQRHPSGASECQRA